MLAIGTAIANDDRSAIAASIRSARGAAISTALRRSDGSALQKDNNGTEQASHRSANVRLQCAAVCVSVISAGRNAKRRSIDIALSPPDLGSVDAAQSGAVSCAIGIPICGSINDAGGVAAVGPERAAVANAIDLDHGRTVSATVTSAERFAQHVSIPTASARADAESKVPTDADGDGAAIVGPIDTAFGVANGVPKLVAHAVPELVSDVDAKQQPDGRAVTAAVVAAYGPAEHSSVGIAIAPSDDAAVGLAEPDAHTNAVAGPIVNALECANTAAVIVLDGHAKLAADCRAERDEEWQPIVGADGGAIDGAEREAECRTVDVSIGSSERAAVAAAIVTAELADLRIADGVHLVCAICVTDGDARHAEHNAAVRCSVVRPQHDAECSTDRHAGRHANGPAVVHVRGQNRRLENIQRQGGGPEHDPVPCRSHGRELVRYVIHDQARS